MPVDNDVRVACCSVEDPAIRQCQQQRWGLVEVTDIAIVEGSVTFPSRIVEIWEHRVVHRRLKVAGFILEVVAEAELADPGRIPGASRCLMHAPECQVLNAGVAEYALVGLHEDEERVGLLQGAVAVAGWQAGSGKVERVLAVALADVGTLPEVRPTNACRRNPSGVSCTERVCIYIYMCVICLSI